VTERPIIFSAPMVRALLEGRKTQTRRVLSTRNTYRDGAPWGGQPKWGTHDWNDAFVDPGPSPAGNPGPYLKVAYPEGETRHRIYPLYAPGDRLWVREAWGINHYEYMRAIPKERPKDLPDDHLSYRATECDSEILAELRYRPSIHMPRWASRITLAVTEVRVQRLQDISRDDAMAEGIVQTWGDFMGDPPEWAVASINRHGDASGSHIYDNRTSVENFRELWSHINGPGSWDANPWVAAISFEVEHAAARPAAHEPEEM